MGEVRERVGRRERRGEGSGGEAKAGIAGIVVGRSAAG